MRSVLCSVLVCGWLVACSSPVTPQTGCQSDGDCGSGLECHQGTCVPKGAVSCNADTDCDPKVHTGLHAPSACETLACVSGLCTYPAKDKGASCDDGDGLTCTGGTCDAAGACVSAVTSGCAIDGHCWKDGDKNPTNECQYCATTAGKAWTDYAADDLVGCTQGVATCEIGVCGSGKCTGQPQDGGKCNDGDNCTDIDLCVKGVCTGAAKDCDDHNACTTDTCDKTAGCQHVAITGACDDGNPCTLADTCTPTGCAPGPLNTCDDQNPCTTDTCNAQTGACAHDPITAGTACQQGAICQVGVCSAGGTCEVNGTAPGYCYIGGTCVATGTKSPDNPCAFCQDANQADWTIASDGSACDTDGVACTIDLCAAGACVHLADDATCTDKVSACTLGHCDVQKGCLAMPADVTVGCDVDGDKCTLDHCGDKSGTCVATAAVADCDDQIACTLDTCDKATGCVHTPQDSACDDGNVCTTDTCAVGVGCTHPPVGGSCALAGDLGCSANTCVAGACQAGVVVNTCAIDGQCVPGGTTHNGGCQTCTPTKNAFAWTLANPDAACESDGIGCTADTCDASGQCQHAATDTLCTPTPDTCLVPQCKPTDAGADAVTGCVAVDACPVGHSCDVVAQACVSPAPVPIAVAGAQGANPTNPAMIRHVLDPVTGTTRTWVVFQTDTCATANLGAWSITKPAGLRAVLLDPVLLPPAQKATTLQAPPTEVLLPAATGWADASTVCQAFPSVAADPDDPTRAWLSWLESAPGQKVACLTGAGQGGLLRLGRLDGALLPPTMGPGLPKWLAVAGDAADLGGSALCTAGDAFLPGFLTGGFAVLPGGGGDVGKEGVVSVRPGAASLNALGAKEMLRTGSANTNAPTDTNPITGSFGLGHPVVVDVGGSGAARFFAIATTEKLASGTTTRAVWAVPISDAGVDDSPQEWSKGTTPSAGSGTGDLHDITAICGLDAGVDAGGNVGVVLAVKRAGKDAVLLVTRAPGAATGTVTTLKEQTSADASCGIGISAVRIAGRASGDFAVEWLFSSGPTDPTLGGIWVTSSANNTPINLATLTAWDTDGSGAPLAWRGLGGLVVGKGGVVSTVIEGRTGTNRAIFLHSFKLP